MNISYFLNSVTKWAENETDIQALILVGSHARGKAREDSDVDLVIISSNPDLYIRNNFIDILGKVIKYTKEDWGPLTSLRTWYGNNGLEVEFGITSADWIKKPLDAGTQRVLTDGYQLLLDKDDYFKDIDIKPYII